MFPPSTDKAGDVKEDELCEDFVKRKKLRQVQVLLASLK